MRSYALPLSRHPTNCDYVLYRESLAPSISENPSFPWLYIRDTIAQRNIERRSVQASILGGVIAAAVIIILIMGLTIIVGRRLLCFDKLTPLRKPRNSLSTLSRTTSSHPRTHPPPRPLPNHRRGWWSRLRFGNRQDGGTGPRSPNISLNDLDLTPTNTTRQSAQSTDLIPLSTISTLVDLQASPVSPVRPAPTHFVDEVQRHYEPTRDSAQRRSVEWDVLTYSEVVHNYPPTNR